MTLSDQQAKHHKERVAITDSLIKKEASARDISMVVNQYNIQLIAESLMTIANILDRKLKEK